LCVCGERRGEGRVDAQEHNIPRQSEAEDRKSVKRARKKRARESRDEKELDEAPTTQHTIPTRMLAAPLRDSEK
jgi:hypothetical protein